MALSLSPSVLLPEGVAVPSRGLMGRLGRRLLDARAVKALPASARKMSLRLQASIAESLLVSRLRARSQNASSADVLARGALVVQVTCNSWFPATSTAPAALPTFRTFRSLI